MEEKKNRERDKKRIAARDQFKNQFIKTKGKIEIRDSGLITSSVPLFDSSIGYLHENDPQNLQFTEKDFWFFVKFGGTSSIVNK